VTDKTIDSVWLWVAAVAVFILGGIAVHAWDAFVLLYPLDTWRMDLDDLLGNIGTLLVGIAALIGLKRAHQKIDQNGTREQDLEQREAADYQLLRQEFAALHAHFEEWDGTTERRQT
jgi:hypothetical protein